MIEKSKEPHMSKSLSWKVSKSKFEWLADAVSPYVGDQKEWKSEVLRLTSAHYISWIDFRDYVSSGIRRDNFKVRIDPYVSSQ